MSAWTDPLLRAEAGEALSPADARALALELFVAGYEGTSLPPDYAEMLAAGLTGVILFKRNLVHGADGALDLEALTAHTRAVHEAGARQRGAGLPVVCSVDQEGGPVARLRKPFTELPPMRSIGERGDLDLARRVGRQLGRECLAAGFNVNYAPVLDVDTNPANPIIGNRSFSRDPQAVADMAGALLAGMQEAGVLGCGKHFPGHGDTDADSHVDLPVLSHDLERLRHVELLPFRAVANQMHLVMTAHVLFPALDARWPATLSPAILEPLLRTECGYSGVIVSDDLEMQGVAKVLDPAACVRAGLRAGVNLFLVCRKRDVLEQALGAAQAVLAGTEEPVLRQAALASIRRVRELRTRLTPGTPNARTLNEVLASEETRNLRLDVGAGNLGA